MWLLILKGSLNFKICVMAINIFKIKHKIKMYKKKSKAIKIMFNHIK